MIELLRARRSIRKYTDQVIPDESINILKEAAIRAPTSRDRKEWLFWFVTDGEQLKQLAESKQSGSKMIGEAPLAIVVGARESVCDVWVEDCSIAAIILQFTAQSLGLGSVWVQIRKRFTAKATHSEDHVKRVLGVMDSDVRIASIIAIGFPDQVRTPLENDKLQWSSIIDQ